MQRVNKTGRGPSGVCVRTNQKIKTPSHSKLPVVVHRMAKALCDCLAAAPPQLALRPSVLLQQWLSPVGKPRDPNSLLSVQLESCETYSKLKSENV